MSVNQPEPPDIFSKTGVERPLVLKFGGSLVEQLGAQLYPSVTATVAELISNAWDADAENVWVSVPFDDDWRDPNAELVVLDDGHGMTRREAQEAYLVVGRKRRFTRLGDQSEGGRAVHGRKGIGKLAAFGTAGYLECTSLRDGVTTSFGIDYDEVRLLNPDQNYFVEAVADPSALVSPSGVALAHGTRVRLTKLRVKRRISADRFSTSMSRRFALRGMNVFINGAPLQRFEIPVQFRLPRDAAPNGVPLDEDGWGIETLPSGDVVKWWIGFTEKPLTDSDHQGISVLARDKMAQRPFKFERSQGTTGQLGLEYLVGEVIADWLDQGDDIDSDYIQSNRDQLQLENARLDEFMEWGRARLRWALRVREELRANLLAESTVHDNALEAIIGEGTSREKRALRAVAQRIAKLPEIGQSDVNTIMQSVVDSRSDSQVRGLMEGIRAHEESPDEELRALVSQFGAIDAKRLGAVVEARLATIETLQAALKTGVSTDSFERLISDDIWLLDPRWYLMGDAVDVKSIKGIESGDGGRKNAKEQAFGLYVLAPTPPAPMDEVVVVRIQRQLHLGATSPRSDIEQEIEVFRRHLKAVQSHYLNEQYLPVVRGLMIIDAADHSVVENETHVSLRVLSWSEVLESSHRMHSGLLKVSGRRSSREGTE